MSETTNMQNTEVAELEIERYLTFISNELVFGVSTKYVTEIIANYAIRSVPTVPGYVQGVMNLRGQVLPVVDLRIMLGHPPKEYDNTTCIIVLDVNSTIIGLIVDSVLQVQDIDAKNASPIPAERNSELTTAMISLEDGAVALLLDCEAIINKS